MATPYSKKIKAELLFCIRPIIWSIMECFLSLTKCSTYYTFLLATLHNSLKEDVKGRGVKHQQRDLAQPYFNIAKAMQGTLRNLQYYCRNGQLLILSH